MTLENLQAWIAPVAVLAAAAALGFVAKRVLVHKMAQLSARTKTDIDDLVVEAVKRHVPLWFLLGGLVIAVRTSPLAAEHHRLLDKIAAAAFALSLSLVAANLATGLLERSLARAGSTIVSSSLTRNVLRGLILVVGGLLVLDQFIEIKPLLTALGVGSLAVALALQPTLSNLFAGLHITLSKPLRIGDFVELENGVQGFVVDIGWRSTQLREPLNNLVIVPNARLVEMIAKNYALPEAQQTVLLQVGVSYGSDLEQVERVTREVAAEVVRSVPEAVADFEPLVRFHAFADSSIDFALVFRVKQFTDRGVVIHELVKRLKARFEREGIEIPFPQRVLQGVVELRGKN